jgi:hypothetical protein
MNLLRHLNSYLTVQITSETIPVFQGYFEYFLLLDFRDKYQVVESLKQGGLQLILAFYVLPRR